MPTAWEDRLKRLAVWLYHGFCRPRVRSVVVGLILLVLAATALSTSVWTLPLLIIGALMLVVAWVGARLDGRCFIEWGEHGTSFEMRARIKPPPQVSPPAAYHQAPAVYHQATATAPNPRPGA